MPSQEAWKERLRTPSMPPRTIPLKILRHMQPAGLKLIPIQPQPQQPAPHAVLFIVRNTPAAAGPLLCQSLVTDRQTELDVCLDLPRMGGAVENAELYGTPGKRGMEIQAVIPGFMVMLPPGFRGTVIPQVCQGCQRPGLSLVDHLYQGFIDLFAIAQTLRRYPQAFVEDVLLLCHKVHQVFQRFRRMGAGVYVDMYLMNSFP